MFWTGMWVAITILGLTAIICECVSDCVKVIYRNRHEEQECCCDSCPMQNECWEAMGE